MPTRFSLAFTDNRGKLRAMAGFRDFGKGDTTPEKTVMSVTEVTRDIRRTLESGFRQVWIEGEISSYRPHSSGHHYFTLKDANAQLSAILFRRSAQNVAMEIANGVQVQALGNISVYEARGQYQLIIDMMQPAGLGVLQAKFEALKRKLNEEGLFAQETKKRLPRFPRTVVLITAGSGAAVRDILSVLKRRAPWLRVLVFPVRVQGDGAHREIAAAIRLISGLEGPLPLGFPKVDTIVVTRGGGSMEDLWNFNEEDVARAIHECPVPIVSAIGHEIDFTIADFVADLRAPTPSAAAELIVPDGTELSERVRRDRVELENLIKRAVRNQRETVRSAGQVLDAHEPTRLLENAVQSVDYAREKLDDAMDSVFDHARNRLDTPRQLLGQFQGERIIERMRKTFDQLVADRETAMDRLMEEHANTVRRRSDMLEVLSPKATLKRGFSVTFSADGKILRSAKDAKKGEILKTELSDGSVESEVS